MENFFKKYFCAAADDGILHKKKHRTPYGDVLCFYLYIHVFSEGRGAGGAG